MDHLDDLEKEILAASGTGLWIVEFEDGKNPRFYANTVMDELLGTDDSMSPEERFVFFERHVHSEDRKMFQNYSDNMVRGARSEVVYRYLHSTNGEMFVRCSGYRDFNCVLPTLNLDILSQANKLVCQVV